MLREGYLTKHYAAFARLRQGQTKCLAQLSSFSCHGDSSSNYLPVVQRSGMFFPCFVCGHIKIDMNVCEYIYIFLNLNTHKRVKES